MREFICESGYVNMTPELSEFEALRERNRELRARNDALIADITGRVKAVPPDEARRIMTATEFAAYQQGRAYERSQNG